MSDIEKEKEKIKVNSLSHEFQSIYSNYKRQKLRDKDHFNNTVDKTLKTLESNKTSALSKFKELQEIKLSSSIKHHMNYKDAPEKLKQEFNYASIGNIRKISRDVILEAIDENYALKKSKNRIIINKKRYDLTEKLLYNYYLPELKKAEIESRRKSNTRLSLNNINFCVNVDNVYGLDSIDSFNNRYVNNNSSSFALKEGNQNSNKEISKSINFSSNKLSSKLITRVNDKLNQELYFNDSNQKKSNIIIKDEREIQANNNQINAQQNKIYSYSINYNNNTNEYYNTEETNDIRFKLFDISKKRDKFFQYSKKKLNLSNLSNQSISNSRSNSNMPTNNLNNKKNEEHKIKLNRLNINESKSIKNIDNLISNDKILLVTNTSIDSNSISNKTVIKKIKLKKKPKVKFNYNSLSTASGLVYNNQTDKINEMQNNINNIIDADNSNNNGNTGKSPISSLVNNNINKFSTENNIIDINHKNELKRRYANDIKNKSISKSNHDCLITLTLSNQNMEKSMPTINNNQSYLNILNTKTLINSSNTDSNMIKENENNNNYNNQASINRSNKKIMYLAPSQDKKSSSSLVTYSNNEELLNEVDRLNKRVQSLHTLNSKIDNNTTQMSKKINEMKQHFKNDSVISDASYFRKNKNNNDLLNVIDETLTCELENARISRDYFKSKIKFLEIKSDCNRKKK